LEHLDAFSKGDFYIQDVAARLAVEAAAAEPGQRVLDCCGAPGGKSFAAAIRMENRGEIMTCDIHPHKIKLIEMGAERLGLNIIRAREQNAREFVPEWENSFDLVMADVPCSGLGIIRKKPDIRFKDPKPLDGLPAVQKGILENVSRYVRPGGVLLYSTCTLRRSENENVIEGFLLAHPNYILEAFELPQPVGIADGMLTLWPHIHGTDGFFIAKLRRKA
jgi:16S rRNA (cytosine967-C5)-methyltransferase